MVVARTLRAHNALVEQLQAREVHRQYLAVVYGAMIAGGSVDAPIGRHSRDRLKQAVVDGPAGKPAVTHYRVRERFRAHTGAASVEIPNLADDVDTLDDLWRVEARLGAHTRFALAQLERNVA